MTRSIGGVEHLRMKLDNPPTMHYFGNFQIFTPNCSSIGISTNKIWKKIPIAPNIRLR